MNYNRILTFSIILILSIASLSYGIAKNVPRKGLKDAFKNQFYIGVAMNESQILEKNTIDDKLIRKHFNSIVAENCMKNANIHPKEGVYNFSLSDKFVEYGIKNKMFIVGHNLIWHEQLAPWFTVDKDGKDVSRDVLIQRMKDHIYTIVGRYKGKIKGWDVVNEAIEDNGELRKTKFLKIIGPEYLELAFKFAHEADPNAELYYNDFSLALPAKRDRVVRLVKDLKSKGIRIDAVGMQSHLSIKEPSLKDYEKSMEAFIQAGVNVNISELDMSVLSLPGNKITADVSTNYAYQKKMNPYSDGLPDNIREQWDKRMLEFFGLYSKYSQHIGRVTLWGLSDKYSWRNDWPIKGRRDYPLLFDTNSQPKSIVRKLIKTFK